MVLRSIIAACALLFSAAATYADSDAIGDGDLLERAYSISKFNYNLNMIAVHSSNDVHLQNTAQEILKKSRGAMERIATISKKEGIYIQARMDQDQRITIKRISTTSGANLEQFYIREGLKAYDGAISLFSKYEQTSGSPRIKKFVQNQLRLHKEQRGLLRWLALRRGVSL